MMLRAVILESVSHEELISLLEGGPAGDAPSRDKPLILVEAQLIHIFTVLCVYVFVRTFPGWECFVEHRLSKRPAYALCLESCTVTG